MERCEGGPPGGQEWLSQCPGSSAEQPPDSCYPGRLYRHGGGGGGEGDKKEIKNKTSSIIRNHTVLVLP